MNVWFLIVCLSGSSCFSDAINYNAKSDCMKASSIVRDQGFLGVCVPSHQSIKKEPQAQEE